MEQLPIANIRWQDFIVEDPAIMLGKPVFKGTRLTVQHILQELSTGTPIPELLTAYPRLTTEHVLAAMQYAAQVIGLQIVEPA